MAGAKIFLISQDTNLRKRLKNLLNKNQFQVIGEAMEGISALRLIRTMGPDLVIVDFELQGMPALDLIKIIGEDRIAPVIIIASTWERELVEKNRQSWIFAFLVRPIEENNLIAIAESALINFERMLNLEKEVAKLKDTLETRKLVEKAKGLIMAKLDLTEVEAFRKIQHQSMDNGLPIKQVAEAIILTYDIGITRKKRF